MTRLTLPNLQDTRHRAFERNRNSKARMTRASRVIREEWFKVWPDLTVEAGEPSIENVFTEAAEDKAASAAAIRPDFYVPPRSGTRNDLAERNAQKGRRIFMTLAQHSNLEGLQLQFYMDWYVYGLPSGIVWKDWNDPGAMPYVIAVDPQHLYPLRWNSKGELSEAMIIKRKPFTELVEEYGPHHPALRTVAGRDPKQFYEEIIWATETMWAVAIARDAGMTDGDFNYRRPTAVGANRLSSAWLVAPHAHNLRGNPIVSLRVHSGDREIRGKLDGMLPNLKNAHEWQVEFNLNLRRHMHAPRLEQNIEPESEYGPDGVVRGVRGPDEAVLAYPRPPVDFATVDQVDRQIMSSRGAGHYPQQRGGDPGASIASGDAVQLLQGGFNSQMAWAQLDIARFYRMLFGRLANADEKWSTNQTRRIDGFDAGEAYEDKYNPRKFWDGDYRVWVSFHAIGVDTHTQLLNMGAAHRLGWLPSRDAMRRSGLVDNPLAAERQKGLEYGVTVFEQGILPALVQQGDFEAYLEYMDKLDSDQATPQAAVQQILSDMRDGAARQPEQAPPPQVTPELLSLIGGGGG